MMYIGTDSPLGKVLKHFSLFLQNLVESNFNHQPNNEDTGYSPVGQLIQMDCNTHDVFTSWDTLVMPGTQPSNKHIQASQSMYTADFASL